MRDLESQRRVPLFVTLLVISLVSMTLDIRAGGEGFVGGFRAGVNVVLTPFQRVGSAIVNPLADFVEGMADIATLRAENQALRSRLARAQAELATFQDLEVRLETLERLHDLNLPDPQLVATEANVIGRTDAFDLTFRIDKGSRSGVLQGHPVLDENGYLVGKVLAVTTDNAVVVPVTADVEDVTVLVGGRTGILSSRVGSDILDLEILDRPVAMAAGDNVVTSQLSVSFPPGIPVGEVIEEAVPNAGVLRAQVRPFSDPQRLRVVVIVAWPPDPTTTGVPQPEPAADGAVESGDQSETTETSTP